MKKEYEIKVKWSDDYLFLRPQFYKDAMSPTTRDTELIFDHKGDEYRYVWCSSPMQGLSWLYKNGEVVYDPHKSSGQHSTMHEAAIQLLHAIRNNGATPDDGWISVEDRLPEVEERVLVYTGMTWPDDKMIGFISRINGHWWDEDANYLQIQVLKWQPLPSNPINK